MKCKFCGFNSPIVMKYCSECGEKQDSSAKTSQNFFNYLAFISYSHKDSNQAKYIEAQLKKYKLPLVIEQNHPDLKALKFDKLFRDENSFGNGSLQDQILFGLKYSKYLIAICSPNYAKANNEGLNWCDEEIKSFLKYHNNDENLIIPVIIDGVPHSENECFPPSLLNLKSDSGEAKEALGIAGKNIENLLGVGFAEKESLSSSAKSQKDEIFDALKARLLGLSYGAYREYAHKIKYFKDYTDKNAIPFGINELENSEWTKTNHYKFVYQEDYLVEVAYENGLGFVIEHSDISENEKIVDSIFKYDDEGKLIEIENRDSHGRKTRIEKFEKDYHVVNFYDANSDSSRLTANFATSGDIGDNQAKKSDIKSIRLIRDENGFVLKKTFQKYHNEIYPVSDNDGFFGIEYENDENGRVKNVFYLGSDSQRFFTKKGIAGKIFEYDKNGNRICETTVDLLENPILDDKYAKCRQKFDENGNLLEKSFYGINDNPVLNRYDFYKICWKYDENGNKIEETYFGINNEPVLYLGHHKVCMKYDEQGNRIEETYFGTSGEAVLVFGYHKRCNKYDEYRNQIEESYFGIDDKPILNKYNYHKKSVVFDKDGNLIEESYFGTDDEPILYYMHHKICYKYDEHQNRIEERIYGVNGEPILFDNDRHKRCDKYDERGNCIEETFYGVNDEPVLHNGTYFKRCSKYDLRGNCIEETYFGINGERVLCYGHFKRCDAFDERRNQIEESFFGLDDEPVLHRKDCHKRCNKYDEHGNCIEDTYFGLNGEPILHKNDYHKLCSKYNNRRNKIEDSFFGVNGEPILHRNDYHKICYKYNEYGKCIEESYFGLNGEPILHKNDYHKRCFRYDERGNRIEITCFDIENNAVICSEGYFREFKTFDERGNCLQTFRYGLNGELLS